MYKNLKENKLVSETNTFEGFMEMVYIKAETARQEAIFNKLRGL